MNDLVCPYLKVTETRVEENRTITQECYMPCYENKCPFFDPFTGNCKKAQKEDEQ